ncbi:hypothetical protein EDC94DRAFT_690580 [Helicostylum pulchrum]|nr:hypothetical protein EDC94DRAFT_690580 [Helicostylum pulchrum]
MSRQEIPMFENVGNSDENETFNEVFTIGKEYSTLSAAREEAFDFGKKNNIVFVTRSSDARQKLYLCCKHGNTPRAQKKRRGAEERKKYRRDTQRLDCPCYIKYGKSPHGKIMIKASSGDRNHPIPKKATTYALM